MKDLISVLIRQWSVLIQEPYFALSTHKNNNTEK